jgi:hypothetical protein
LIAEELLLSSGLEPRRFKTDFRFLNGFLIENMGLGRHVRGALGPSVAGVWSLLGRNFQGDNGKREGLGRGKIHAQRLTLVRGKMTLFSRSFIRKRAISFATTASVAAVSLVMAHGPTSAHRIRVAVPIQYVADRSDHSSEATFRSENEAAMSKMTTDMMVKPTGDVDRDFVAMMVPHHQGAIEMAKSELKYGHNELLRRLAKEIITNQQQEITVMRLAVDDERPLPPDSPTQPGANPPPISHETTGMSHGAEPRD